MKKLVFFLPIIIIGLIGCSNKNEFQSKSVEKVISADSKSIEKNLMKMEGQEKRIKKTHVSLSVSKKLSIVLKELGEIENRYYILEGKEFDIKGFRGYKIKSFEELNDLIKSISNYQLSITKNKFHKKLPKTVQLVEYKKSSVLDEIIVNQKAKLIPSKVYSEISRYADGWRITPNSEVAHDFKKIDYMDFNGTLREFLEQYANEKDYYVDYKYHSKNITFSKYKKKILRLKVTSESYNFLNNIEVNLNSTEGEDKKSKTGVEIKSKYDIYKSVKPLFEAIIPKNTKDEYIRIIEDTGHIVVKARPSKMLEVESTVDELNESSFKQVYIKATLLETNVDNNLDRGINWGYIEQKLDSLGNVKGITVGGINGSVPDLTTSLGTDSLLKFRSNGSGATAVVKLLNEFGDTAISYQAPVITTNHIPAIYNLSKVLGFVEEFKTESVGDNAQLATKQATVTGGTYMYVKPAIYDDVIQLSIKMVTSRINPFIKQEFGNGQYVQSKDLGKQLFSQNVVLKSGEKIIIGGIKQKDYTKSYSGASQDAQMFGSELFGIKGKKTNSKELALMIEVVEI